MKLVHYLFAIPISMLAIGCGQSALESAQTLGDDAASAKSMPMESGTVTAFKDMAGGASAANFEKNAPASAPSKPDLLQNRMVIRSGTLAIRVDQVESAEKSVNRIVRNLGGYVSTATSNDLASNDPVLTISMRIPATAFDAAITQFEALGVRMSKTISSSDVTEQVVDMDARIRTMMVEEDTYRKLLAQTHGLSEMMPLQQRLTELRGTIESIESQRASLAKQAAYSNIDLTLQQSAVANQAPKDPNWLAQVWGQSTSSFGDIIRVAASALIWLLVFSPLWGPALYALSRIRRSKPSVRVVEDF